MLIQRLIEISMYSVSKKEDRELLLELADTIQVFANGKTTQALDAAEALGVWYLELAEKVKHHDYSQDDRDRERPDEILRKFFSKK